MTVVDELTRFPAYALVRFGDSDSVTVLGGVREDFDRLADVPLGDGPPEVGRPFDRLLAVPFRQVRERGFEAHDDGAPLSSIAIEQQRAVPLDQLLAELPDEPVEIIRPGRFDVNDASYADLVRRAVNDEIGRGEGANLVLARSYRARLGGWGTSAALSAFRRLLSTQRGAYWTFLACWGDRYLLGASPERHVSVRSGQVAMNPISGTFRLAGPDATAARRKGLLDFLADEKEIYELFMVVDEELKVMCEVCAEGGQVLGPYLKPMSHLVHTEYLLAGRTSLDVREVLRMSMYAATVTGSPVKNACRLIRRYEPTGRGYYGAVLALLGRDRDGSATADAPILIRTADVDTDGNLRVTAGATLVRDSDARQEVLETHAKAAGVLSAFGLAPPAASPAADVRELVETDAVLTALGSRNQRLSDFWLTDQSATQPDAALLGRRVLLIDGEDDFVHMLAHVLTTLGMRVRIVGHGGYAPGDFSAYDLVVVGPGPGDPRDTGNPKIKALAAATDELLASGHPFLAVCLGHQVLCARLGLVLEFKDVVFQGTQQLVRILGREEHVGFYNTFVARVPDPAALPAGVSAECDPASGDVHLITGPHYRGVQFHAESLLTQHGYELLRELITPLLGVRLPPS